MHDFNEQVRFILGFKKETPAHVVIDTWFRSSGAFLEPLTDEQWEDAKAKIQEKSFDAVKALMVGNYFWHPDTGKCPRCWNHVPECRESQSSSSGLCLRCENVMGK